MAATGFEDMWNPDYLYYDGDVGRIFHRKWHGLSFAHEVEYEQGEDPVGNFAPIVERMRTLCRVAPSSRLGESILAQHVTRSY